MTGRPDSHKDRWTFVLALVFTTTLAIAFVVDTPRIWLCWAAATVAVSGTALVVFNRGTPHTL